VEQSSVTARSSIALPTMPPIGQPEGFYARQIHQAERRGDQHSREAGKVGQYITLGLDPNLEWEQKLRYFQHALRRHCIAPPLAPEEVWLFYGELAALVRKHAGNEMLRLASREDDIWARRIRLGQVRDAIVPTAISFFNRLLGGAVDRPNYVNQEDWDQLRMIQREWMG
jgi:hypothetical protein